MERILYVLLSIQSFVSSVFDAERYSAVSTVRSQTSYRIGTALRGPSFARPRFAPNPLPQPTFRSLWIAALASNFGGLVQAVGAAWLMTSLSNSQNMVALVQGSVALPIMIFSLLAGVFADNFDRRRVMLNAQSSMFGVSILLTIMAFEGWLMPWLLLVFTFSIGCGTALHNPSRQATMSDIVSREKLP